jgi:hypothetical protein
MLETDEYIQRQYHISRFLNHFSDAPNGGETVGYLETLPISFIIQYTVREEPAEVVVRAMFEKLGFEVKDTRNECGGHPDYIVRNKAGEELFVEVKEETDAIRLNQIEWRIKQNKPVVFIFIKRVKKLCPNNIEKFLKNVHL